MSSIDRQEAGSAGEQAALEHLKRKGLKLVQRNYRCRGGEIDLVMLDGATLALIEVRLRNDPRFGGAAASVDSRKQKRLTVAARHLMLSRPDLGRYRARFDVVAMESDGNGLLEINWIKDAFRMI